MAAINAHLSVRLSHIISQGSAASSGGCIRSRIRNPFRQVEHRARLLQHVVKFRELPKPDPDAAGDVQYIYYALEAVIVMNLDI